MEAGGQGRSTRAVARVHTAPVGGGGGGKQVEEKREKKD
jgi:hypothetical protein